MQEFLINIFGDFGRLIVFIHILSGSFLLGSIFTIRFIVKPVFTSIDDEITKYGRCIRLLDKYFMYLFVVMALIISASLTMTVGLGFEYANPTIYSLIHVKEALWLFIAFNFIYMYVKLKSATKLFKRREFLDVHEHLSLILNFLMPLNLILTVVSAYIGIIIRGF